MKKKEKHKTKIRRKRKKIRIYSMILEKFGILSKKRKKMSEAKSEFILGIFIGKYRDYWGRVFFLTKLFFFQQNGIFVFDRKCQSKIFFGNKKQFLSFI